MYTVVKNYRAPKTKRLKTLKNKERLPSKE